MNGCVVVTGTGESVSRASTLAFARDGAPVVGCDLNANGEPIDVNDANNDRRVAVVTGGAGAIGAAIVSRLSADHTVVVLDRTGDVFDEFDLDVWRQVQSVNVESVLLPTQAFAPGTRDRGFGRVIFIVSNTFWRPPGAHMLAYVASKGALIGMARTLAVGLGSDGIAVAAVARDSRALPLRRSFRRTSSPMSRRTRRFRGCSLPTTPPLS